MVQCPCCHQSVPSWMDGKIRVDLNTNVLTYEGKQLQLSNKQAELAYVLGYRAGIIVEFETLTTKIWGSQNDAPETANCLRIHVSMLRKQLRSIGLTIESIRFIGYRMVVL